MKKILIAKGNGKFRTIYAPSFREKMVLRSMTSSITRKAARACPPNVCHGFTSGRSPVTNAQAHVGHAFTLRFDLKDFFDTVTPDKLSNKLSKDEMAIVFVDGAARQGLPTSPAVANLAAAGMDKLILELAGKRDIQFIYTRYADDLTLSYDDPAVGEILLKEIPSLVARCGFVVNHGKTRLQRASAGRRIITGVAVDEAIHPTRGAKRKLRAALHQGNAARAAGLAEWCKLKSPKARTTFSSGSGDELDRLNKAWRLPRLDVNQLPDKGPDVVDGDLLITGDPVYMLGMSTWTTGWTSCMRQPSGQYRRGVLTWCYIQGTRIAATLSEKTTVIAEVERRTMKTRTLLHRLENGVLVYDRCYGNPNDIPKLVKKLRKMGCLEIGEARAKYPGMFVVGGAPSKHSPYLDSLIAVKSKDKYRVRLRK